MNINPASLNASFLPDVFFTKILLESSATPNNDTSRPNTRFPEIEGEEGDPSISKRKSQSVNTGGSLKVTLSLTIMDHIDENGITSWFYNEDLTKYLKIKIIQSQSRQLTAGLTKGNYALLDQRRYSTAFREITIPVKKDENQYITDFISLDTSNNKRIFSIDYTLDFIINDLEPQHLSYFAVCYFDLGALTKEYEMDFLLPDSNANLVRGNIVGEKVIVDSNLQLETYVFVLNDGTIWPGPVHRAQSTVQAGYLEERKYEGDVTTGPPRIFSTGETDTAKSQHLTRTKVANSKIQDFREIDALKLMDFDLTPADNIFSTIEEGISGTQRVIQNQPEVYFSPAFVSFSLNGDAKFLFQLDYNRIIRDKTQFGNIIDKASNPPALAEIYAKSQITLLKVLRRRVRYGTADNRLGSPVFGKIIVDPTEPVTLVTMSSDEGGVLKSAEDGLGGIKEISLNSSQQFRTFTITDKESSDITDGYYQYGVQIEIKDGTVDFLNQQLMRLIRIRDQMKLYYSTASMPVCYNSSSQRFTGKLKQYYSRYDTDQLPWIQSISIFIEVLTSLTQIDNPKSLGKRLFSFINPNSGSLEGINAFVGLIEMLETKLEYILGPKIHVQTPGNETKRNIKTRFKTSVISLSRFFNKIWDSNERSDLGLDYLSIPPSSGDVGLKGVTVQDFKTRIEQENSIYWTTPNLDSLSQDFAASALEGVTSNMLGITNLKEVEESYLTPGVLYGGKDFVVDRLDVGQEAFNDSLFAGLTNTYVATSTGQYGFPGNQDNQSSPRSATLPDCGQLALENILGQLNISIIPSPPTQFDLLAHGQLDKGMLPVADILGPYDHQVRADLDSVTANMCEEEIEKTEKDTRIRKSVPVGNIFVQNLALTGQLNNRQGQRQGFKTPFISPQKRNITNFDLNNTQNVFDKLKNNQTKQTSRSESDNTRTGMPFRSSAKTPFNATRTPGAPTVQKRQTVPPSVFPLIPNQIRSLMLNRSDAVKNKWVDMGIDIINSTDTSELYRYNYDLIVQVEVFRGYQMSQTARGSASGTPHQRTTGATPSRAPQSQSVNLMKSPIFTRLDAGELSRLNKTRGNAPLLCRIRKYTNETLGVGISDGIDVKFFDEYFLISKSPSGFRTPRKKSSSARSIDTLGLSKMSVGHAVMGVLMSESRPINESIPALQSNIIIEQRSKKKLDIL